MFRSLRQVALSRGLATGLASEYDENKTSLHIEDTLRSWRRCLHYDIFRYAAKDWGFSEKKVEEDFKVYLSRGEIPRYVLDYIKKGLHGEGV